MKNLLEFILIHIVTYPDDVRVDEKEGEGESIYTITVNPEDLGRVIGRRGNIIQSIRSIAKVRAMKEHKRIRVMIDETLSAAHPAEVKTEIAE
ncbi:MAG: KH domain-containing protein [Candidatus Pacebacteria bacterium]|nr:KH domain-containing protein [Candidatus Paceibacterota bacterium]